jgi:ABC-type multidrug transport system fused ATPase/permease subunit
VRLVQRLHDLDGGAILIDGQDIATVRQDSLHAQIAMVPQEPTLTHAALMARTGGLSRDLFERQAQGLESV